MAGDTDLFDAEGCFLATDPARRRSVEAILRSAGIDLAVAHGSRVGGSSRPASDFDVAVLAADGRPLSYSAMGALAADLSAVLFVEVDVGDLATPDAVFRYEVARSGRTIFEGRAGARAAFVAKALIDYSDIQRFLPALVEGVARRARREAERRLAGRSA